MSIIKRIGLLTLALAIFVTVAGTGAHSVLAGTDCSVSITAGGLGGGTNLSGGYNLSIGWGLGISNTAKSGNCSVSVSPSERPDGAYGGGSYSIAPGQSFGEGPYKNVTNVSVPYPVSMSASVSCPAGNSPVAPQGTTASCSLNLGKCSVDGLGNKICQVDGCSNTKTITCPSVPVPPTVSLSANPMSIPWYGGNTTLTWTVAHASSCSSSWGGSVASSDGSHSETVGVPFYSGNRTYSVTCANSDGSATDSVTVTKGGNTAPLVSVSAPSTATEGSNVPISASASDSDGKVMGVEFFVDSSSIGSDSSAPYTASWTATPGTHSISARATDDGGATADDSTSISVAPNPTNKDVFVTLSASPSNVSWWTGGNVALTWSVGNATACSSSWSGSVASSDGSHSANVFIGPFSNPQTYSISCTGTGRPDSASVTVNVANSDLCKDIPGEQTSVPAGHTRDASGNCPADTTPPGNNPNPPANNPNPPANNPNPPANNPNPPAKCNDPEAWNFGEVGECIYASFTISADPSIVKAKSLAGYSGATEKDFIVSVNPVYGFTAPVLVEIDTSSLPGELKPEYSFAGDAYTPNPSAILSFDGSYWRYKGLINLPISIRFSGAPLEKDKQYSVRVKATAMPGGKGTGKTAQASVGIDSKPIYPSFREE